jgi:hypothetical protein
VNLLSESTSELYEEKTSSKELEDTDDRNIVALETSQVKEDHSELDNKKELKNRYLSKDVDNAVFKALSISERSSKLYLSTYALLTGFGFGFVAFALIYSALFGLGLSTAFFMCLGIASFGSILLIAPQSKILRNELKIGQYYILYSGYVNQLAIIRNNDEQSEKSANQTERTSRLLEQVTFNTIDKITTLSKN